MKTATHKKSEEGLLSVRIVEINEDESDVLTAVPKVRAGSAPPVFDSSSLFLYMEDDVYTRSFTKGPCVRKESFNDISLNHSKQKINNSSQVIEELNKNDSKQLSKDIVRFNNQ